jgi:phenylacetate-CoA ligase
VQLETMYSEVDGQVATLTLNRPDVLNCANEQWARDLNTLVKVEPQSSMADERATCEEAARALQQHIKSYIGVTASVVMCDPGTVERSVGKAKRVIDRRAAGA